MNTQLFACGDRQAGTTGQAILIIDDNPDDREAFVRALKKTNKQYTYFEASDGASGLEFLARRDVDCVLLDYSLSGRNGVAVLEQIRSANAVVPVVMLTGQGSEAIAVQAMKAGAHNYLVKGALSPDILDSAIGSAIEHAKLETIKSEFISIVSHELRTPLTSIRGALALMGVLTELPPKVQRLVDVADQNSRRLALLVNDIIDIDKITTGQMSFEFRNEEVKSIILELIDTMRPFAERLNIDLQSANPSKDVCVITDRSRIIQVLNNLISNAIKFSPEGGKVDINVEVRERDVRIAVHDRGPGIPEDFRKRLFDRFAQAENTLSRRRDGSGLGLYISKQLIERMEGSIGIDPRPGGGTIAWIMLPVHSEA